jgi:lipid A 3-O-deacylase
MARGSEKRSSHGTASQEEAMKAPLALLLFFLTSTAWADGAVFNAVFENDVFAGNDRHYTSGILFNYVPSRDGTPRFLRHLAYTLPAIGPGDEIHTAFYLGHQIFTPDDTDTETLLPDERPYAGYFFGGISLLGATARKLDTWNLTLGIVGPSAYAREFQTSIHERLGAKVTRGWDNQLKNEAIVQLNYNKTWRQFWRYASDGSEADLMPYAGFALGNAAVHADAGLILRVGEGLGNDFGPPRMWPSLPGSAFFDVNKGSNWYFFFGFGGRYVAHNIFLDGNTHNPSHSVDKYNWVADLQVGVVLNTKRYRLAYGYVGRSREFKGQKQAIDLFGSLTLSLRF